MRVKLNVEPKWTEATIGKGLAFGLLNSRSVLVVPNCNWTGHEADLLVVDKSLRIIDVEIKISRADLKADLKKRKWWDSRPWSRHHTKIPREWPEKVWKHYYAMPASIWDDKLIEAIPKASGILLLKHNNRCSGGVDITVKRAAKPCKDAKPIAASDAIDIARLASLRMWTSLTKP